MNILAILTLFIIPLYHFTEFALFYLLSVSEVICVICGRLESLAVGVKVCLENPMDRGDWQATAHRVTESNTTEHARIYTLNLSNTTKQWFSISVVVLPLPCD